MEKPKVKLIKFSLEITDIDIENNWIKGNLIGDKKTNNGLCLTYNEFTNLALMLNTYVYTNKTQFTDAEWIVLWNLKVNIHDNPDQKTIKSIFRKNISILKELGLLGNKY